MKRSTITLASFALAGAGLLAVQAPSLAQAAKTAKTSKASADTAGATTAAPTTALPSNEFVGQQVSKLATSDADYLCKNQYDSVDPVSMFIELAQIAGPAIIMRKVPDLATMTPAENKKTMDQLRELARRKIWLPISAETSIGGFLNDKYTSDGQVIADSKLNLRDRNRFKQVRTLMDSVIATLPNDNPYKFNLAAVQGDASNAWVMPGGYVYVTQGMLRDTTLTNSDIALRLAHETSHLTRRHALKDLQLKLIDAMAISNDMSGMLKVATDPLDTFKQLLGKANSAQLLFQRFDQNQELEADACGMQLMTHMEGVDARQALADYVADRPGSGTSKEKSWDDSHPAPAEREYVMNMQLNPGMRTQYLAHAGKRDDPLAGPKDANGQPVSPLGKGAATRAPATAAVSTDGSPTQGTPAPADSGGFGGLLNKVRNAIPTPPGGLQPTQRPQDGMYN